MIHKLHFISNQTDAFTHLESIATTLDAGCKWIQLRIKNEPVSSVLETAFLAKKLCDLHKAKLIINDYPEVAREVDAFGIHLGLDDMSVKAARQIVGNKIIGGTANTFQDVLNRIQEGADYVGLGPYRFTKTKQNLSPILGPEGYRSILEGLQETNIRIPVIAIGGITDGDIPGLLSTGVHGVAMSSAITNTSDPKQFVTQLYKTLC